MELGTVHLLSSYAAVNYPEYAYDYARLGILMFGVKSSPADYLREDLQPMPVMTLKARITSVREIGPGETVSYGRIFRAERPTKVASVSIGYADGIPRCLSGGKLRAIVRGQYAQGIGRICMDQLMLDVTGIEDVRVGVHRPPGGLCHLRRGAGGERRHHYQRAVQPPGRPGGGALLPAGGLSEM